jgi:hypothetical protein
MPRPARPERKQAGRRGADFKLSAEITPRQEIQSEGRSCEERADLLGS